MSLEGELRVALRLQAGRIAAVDITSSRPDIAHQLLQGRRSAEVQAAVPLLFSVCARSQAAACQLACAAAAGATPDTATLTQARAALAEETVRETAWQALLHLPGWMDETPTSEATAAARAAQAWRWSSTDAGRGADCRPDRSADRSADHDGTPAAAIAHAVFGCSAQAWLQRASWPALSDWAAAGETAVARYLHTWVAQPNGEAALPAVPLLPPPTPGWLAAVAAAAVADPAYVRRPLWLGRPSETGALARLQGDPLVGSAAAAAPSRPLARHVARLRELALLLEGRLQPGLGALTLAPGSGIAWADNARGLLVHHVQLDAERVALYRIIAPTEWNFHPQGALAAALVGRLADDGTAARQHALRLVRSLDPCVTCTVEVGHA